MGTVCKGMVPPKPRDPTWVVPVEDETGAWGHEDMGTITLSLLLPSLIPRRRFPWNLILLSIFVSRGPWVRGWGVTAGTCPTEGTVPAEEACGTGNRSAPALPSLTQPFYPADLGHELHDGDHCQVPSGALGGLGSLFLATPVVTLLSTLPSACTRLKLSSSPCSSLPSWPSSSPSSASRPR